LSAARSLPPVTGKLPYSCYHIFDDTNVGIAFSGTWALQVNMSVYIYGDGTTTVRDMIVNGGVLSVYCNVASTFIDGLPSNNLVINFQKDFTCMIDKPELITMPQTSNDYFYQPVEMMNLVDSVGNIYSVRFSSDRRASRLMRITPSGDVTVISVPDTIYYLFNIADRVYMCCGSGLYAVDNMVVVELYLADWVYMGCPQDDGKILIS